MDPNMLTVSGHGIFKLYRAENLGLRSVQHSLTKRDTTNFTAQCWISGQGSLEECTHSRKPCVDHSHRQAESEMSRYLMELPCAAHLALDDIHCGQFELV